MQFFGVLTTYASRRRIFKCTDIKIKRFILDKNSETFDVLRAFLSLVVAKLSALKNSPVFGPPCKIRLKKPDRYT